MLLRVWWNEDVGLITEKLTGKVLTGIVVGSDNGSFIVLQDDGEFAIVNPFDPHYIKSAWVDRP
jgi:hypothetical protein